MPREQRPLQCEECKQTFNVYSTWYSHKVQKHGEPNVPCKHCDEKFKTVALRNAHFYHTK